MEFKIGDTVSINFGYIPPGFCIGGVYKVLQIGRLDGKQYITINPTNENIPHSSWSQYSRYFTIAFDPNSVEIESFL